MVTGQSTNVDVTDRGLKGILRVCQRDDFEAPATARFCKDSLGIQTIFLVNDQQAFGAGQCEAFAAEAAQIGLDVVANEGIVSNEVDFSAVVNQIAAANPDAVYYGGNYPEGSLLLKQIRDKGITSIYVGSSGVDTSELVNIAGKENAVGAYYISSSPAFDSSAVLQEWVDRYQQTSGLAADGYAHLLLRGGGRRARIPLERHRRGGRQADARAGRRGDGKCRDHEHHRHVPVR